MEPNRVAAAEVSPLVDAPAENERPDYSSLNPDIRDLGMPPERPPDLEGTPFDTLADITETPSILIVDDLDINRRLLRAMLKTSDYRIREAKRAAEAFMILANEKIDLIIVDLMMPEISGPEFCRRVKSNRRTQLTPILMATSVQGVENEVAGIASGADEFLLKPIHPTVVRTRVASMLRNKALIDSLEEAETILFALAQSVEHRDLYTGFHCQRLANYGVALGKALGLPRLELLALFRGGFMHDIGKIAIPDRILFKNGRLTAEEWHVMRMHTVRGEEICRPMRSLAPVLPIIRSHHERWDGTGYPDGLKGENIPLLARILQTVDIYDALVTERPYKPAHDPAHALEILEQEAARGWRDADLVSMFAEVSRTLPPDPVSSIEMTTMQQSLESMNRHLR